MTLECINPEDLPTPLTYTQVVVATGSRQGGRVLVRPEGSAARGEQDEDGDECCDGQSC